MASANNSLEKCNKKSADEYSMFLLSVNIDENLISDILNGKYFQIVKCDNRKLKAICMHCPDLKIKEFSAWFDSTSNLLRHLKTQHANQALEYGASKKSRKRSSEDSNNNALNKKHEESITGMLTHRKQAWALTSKVIFEKKILSFVANALLPLSIVDGDQFRELIEYLDPNAVIPSRRRLPRCASIECRNMLAEVKTKLDGVNYVCTTADIWSTKHRSYMGVTVHWINVDFTRSSAAVACRRFKGIHSYDKIAELLEGINEEMSLSYKKIVATVSDNASNFVKCFKEFGVTVPVAESEDSEESEEDNEDDELEDFDIVDFPELPEEPAYKLPAHLRCASHTLNLVATTDAAKGLKAPVLSKLKHVTMGKCSALWKAAGRPKTSEIIKEVTGRELRYPCTTRWNSMYDSLAMINSLKTVINSALLQLKLPVFKENEFEFISEYLAVMKPIATTLDKLQSEKECFYGCLIPALLITQQSLSPDATNDLRLIHCKPLLTAVASGFEKRFETFLTSTPEATDAVLATLSHPFFKLRWVKLLRCPLFIDLDTLKSKYKNMLQLAVRASTVSNGESKGTTANDGGDVFYQSLEGPSSEPTTETDLEVLQYLQDPCQTLQSLDRFPSVKAIFMRYNTALPSSAPVERLFSFAGMIFSPKRSRLTDTTFERLVLLKANSFKG